MLSLATKKIKMALKESKALKAFFRKTFTNSMDIHVGQVEYNYNGEGYKRVRVLTIKGLGQGVSVISNRFRALVRVMV